jgi:hypothetical protein
MKLIFLIYVIALVPSLGADVRVVLQEVRDSKGVTLIEAPLDSLESSPAWSPDQGQPPLPVEAAYRLVQKRIALIETQFDSFGLVNISLQRIEYPSIGVRWYYIVGMAPIIADELRLDHRYSYAVLMDGFVIEPLVKLR